MNDTRFFMFKWISYTLSDVNQVNGAKNNRFYNSTAKDRTFYHKQINNLIHGRELLKTYSNPRTTVLASPSSFLSLPKKAKRRSLTKVIRPCTTANDLTYPSDRLFLFN